MARYESEFMGIPAKFVQPEGLDPNYGEGYYGMRMGGGRGRAPYGSHRLTHLDDMDGAGFGGIHGSRRREVYRGYDRGWEREGGVMRRNDDPRLLHQYNARSDTGDRRYDVDLHRGGRMPVRSWSPSREFRGDYANRGMTQSGYGQPWARFPMRGGR